MLSNSFISKSDVFKPEFVFIIYKKSNSEEDHIRTEPSVSYTEYATITNNKISSGFKPLSPKEFEYLRNNFNNSLNSNSVSNSIKGIIPKNLLYINQDSSNSSFIWLCSKKQRTIYYHDQELLLDVPHLIFKVLNNLLYVYAVNTPKVNPNTPLYQITFGNINGSQKVCLGNTKRKHSFNSYTELMESYENYFFNSRFTDAERKFNPALIKTNLNLKFEDIL